MSRATTPASRRRPLFLALGGLLVAGLVGALIAWQLYFAGEPPVRASIGDAAGVLQSGTPTEPAAVASDAPEPTSATAPAGGLDGIDGTWTVDTSVGSFADYTSAWAGFRVNEVLGQGIGSTTAIGRTPAVSGSLTLEGQTLTAATLEVDLTIITSDRPRRDDAIQRALDTSQFPTATFVLTAPVDLGGVPADGETVSVSATGDLTIHGVTRSVDLPLEAQLVGDAVVVVGSAPITFSDFGVEMPSAPIVVSVEDSGIVELQLFFRRA